MILYFSATGNCKYVASRLGAALGQEAVSIFDLSMPEKVAAFTKTTEEKIEEVIGKIQKRHTNKRMSPHAPAIFSEWFAQPLYNGKMRKTTHFHMEVTRKSMDNTRIQM